MTGTHDQVPAEVRAAQRALGTYQPSAQATNVPSIPVRGTDSNDVDAILTQLLEAEVVDIIGVLPLQCVDRLVKLHAERVSVNPDSSLPSVVRYFTPARDRITLYRQSGVLGTLVQRWMTGVTGLRNWLDPRTMDPTAAQRLWLYEFDDMYLDCVIYTRQGDQESGVAVSQLPVLISEKGATAEGLAVLVPSVMSKQQVEQVKNYITILEHQASPFTPRQLRCTLPSGDSSGREFEPLIKRVASYGRLAEGDVEPIAVIGICADTASGPSVLLKPRTESNSRDDFRTLSLVSERILIEDLADLRRGTPDPDHDRALDQLWIDAGKPRRFEIPEVSFKRAAQRELFLSCGLDVHEDRLRLVGRCILDREDRATYLGFYVFRLELVRSPVADELLDVRKWNPDLVLIPVSELYGPRYGPRLNRLLRRKEDWLSTRLFSGPLDDAGVST